MFERLLLTVVVVGAGSGVPMGGGVRLPPLTSLPGFMSPNFPLGFIVLLDAELFWCVFIFFFLFSSWSCAGSPDDMV